MKFSYNEYNRIRNAYLSSKNNRVEVNKILNLIIEDKFKEYSKHIEEENRVRNILKIFFENEFWNEFKTLNLKPQEFYNKFLMRAKQLNIEKNKLNFEVEIHYEPKNKNDIEELEHKLYIVTVDTVNNLQPLYDNYYKEYINKYRN